MICTHLHVVFFFGLFFICLLFSTAATIFSTLPSVFQCGTVGRLNVGLSSIIGVDYLYTKCNFLLYIFVKGCDCFWLLYY